MKFLNAKYAVAALAIFFCFTIQQIKAQVNTQDSLALVDLYDSTGGLNWTNNTNWLTKAPVSSWYGVTVDSGRVRTINLYNNNLIGVISFSLGNLSNLIALNLASNNLSGSIPSSLGSLVNLQQFDLDNNQLIGSIPASLGNALNLNLIDFHDNQLSGSIPASLGNLKSLSYLILRNNLLSGTIPTSLKNLSVRVFYIDNNQLTFDGMEGIVNLAIGGSDYAPQATIPLQRNGNILSVSVGGTLANDTFQWYKDGELVSTKVGDSTYSTRGNGDYWVVATNAVATQLALNSETVTISSFIDIEQDSLALVDLYNSTNGPNWTNHTNWLTKAPVSSWFGVTADSLTGRVVGLNLTTKPWNNPPFYYWYLRGVKLNGTIPESIGDLTELRTLVLTNIDYKASFYNYSPPVFSIIYDSTTGLTGAIPSSFANLTKLTQLDLSFNHLTGEIPNEISNFNSLTNLSLESNNFTGTIPDSIGNLTNLDTLFVNANQLTSTIPAGIGNLTKLKDLDLSNNLLSGTIPDTLSNLRKALTGNNFNLSNNQFNFSGFENFVSWTDTVHRAFIFEDTYYFSFAPQNTLLHLNKSENILSVSAGGTLANDTFKWYRDSVLVDTKVGDSTYTVTTSGLYHVVVTNSIVSYPKSFFYHGLVLSSDTVFVFSPVNTNDSLVLVDFYYSTNGANWKNNTNWLSTNPISTWKGIVLDSSGRVSQINLYTNNLTGTLPSSLGYLTHLTSISLHINAIGGEIPTSIGNLKNLTNLDLGENSFTGTIPDSLASLTKLTQLDLSSNQLTGSIPAWIGNFSNLQDLWLQYNSLSDSIPSSIGNLTRLQYLVLQNNQLNGPIPASFGKLNNLQGLFLQNNAFTFDGMELVATKFPFAEFAPQASIHLLHPIDSLGNMDFESFYVSIGGTPANDTFHWSELYSQKSIESVADSVLNTRYLNWYSGLYTLTVTNSIANKLTLYSDTGSIITEPIKSITIQSKEIDGQVLLKWQTIVELNTESFIIQHSTDGITFTDITTKDAVGSGNNNYSMMDKLPASSTNYYRIKVIDKDGEVSYSNVASLQLSVNSNQLSVFPNPTKDKITIKGIHIVSIQLVDNLGRVIKTQTLKDATNPMLSVGSLPAGVYHLRVQNTDGKVSGVGFVKE